MAKAVKFLDKESFEVRLIPSKDAFSPEDKVKLWMSRFEILHNKQLVQEEALLEHIRTAVKAQILESHRKNGRNLPAASILESAEELDRAVEVIMGTGLKSIAEFLHIDFIPAMSQGERITKPHEKEEMVPHHDDTIVEQVKTLVATKIERDEGKFLSAKAKQQRLEDILSKPRMQIAEYLGFPIPKNKSEDYLNGDLYWNELPPKVQEAAQVLGHNQESWDNAITPPPCEKVWDDLTPEQQIAVNVLGQTKAQWDGDIHLEKDEDSGNNVDVGVGKTKDVVDTNIGIIGSGMKNLQKAIVQNATDAEYILGDEKQCDADDQNKYKGTTKQGNINNERKPAEKCSGDYDKDPSQSISPEASRRDDIKELDSLTSNSTTAEDRKAEEEFLANFLSFEPNDVPSSTDRTPRNKNEPQTNLTEQRDKSLLPTKEILEQVRHLVELKLEQEEGPFPSLEDKERRMHRILSASKQKIAQYLQAPIVRRDYFQDNVYWEDMPSPMQEAARVLGYNQQYWDESKLPPESDQWWDDLTTQQQRAAIILGQNPEKWDSPTESKAASTSKAGNPRSEESKSCYIAEENNDTANINERKYSEETRTEKQGSHLGSNVKDEESTYGINPNQADPRIARRKTENAALQGPSRDTLFMERYELEDTPRYESRSCKVFFSFDWGAFARDLTAPKAVTLKFMSKLEDFERELKARWTNEGHRRFLPEYVIGEVTFYRADGHKSYANACMASNKPKYCIVLEQGDRSLLEVINSQDIFDKPVEIKNILANVCETLLHIHQKGYVHCNVKPRNIVRSQMGGNSWKLLDFSASGRIGEKIEAEVSTGFSPPESMPNFEARSPKRIQSFICDPSFDVWSFGITMYHLMTGHSYFHCNYRDNIVDAKDLALLVDGVIDDDKLLHLCDNSPLAYNLLKKIFQADPSARPSIAEILHDPFFECQDKSSTKIDQLALMQACPLVDSTRTEQGENSFMCFDQIDFEREACLLEDYVDEAIGVGGRINIVYETASMRGLETIEKDRSLRVLHLSGHCNPDYFALESNGMATSFPLSPSIIERLNLKHLSLVYVCASQSESIGKAFLRAGVSHVICVKNEVKIHSSLAELFTGSLYRSLATSHTLRYSYGVAQHEVENAEKLQKERQLRIDQAKSFLLLTRSEDASDEVDAPVFFRGTSYSTRLSNWSCGTSNYCPMLPSIHLTREIDMHNLIEILYQSRQISCTRVVGSKGIGRTSLVSTTCQYILKRPTSYGINNMIWWPPASKIDQVGNDICVAPSNGKESSYTELIQKELGRMSQSRASLSNTGLLLVLDGRRMNQETESVLLRDIFNTIVKEYFQLEILKVIVISDRPTVNPHYETKLRVQPMAISESFHLLWGHLPNVLKDDYGSSTDLIGAIYTEFSESKVESIWNDTLNGNPGKIIEIAASANEESNLVGRLLRQIQSKRRMRWHSVLTRFASKPDIDGDDNRGENITDTTYPFPS